MTVRGKFYVDEVTRRAFNTEQATVTLRPVTRGEENREWSAATPSGQIVMGICNEAAARFFIDAFDAKREVYVDFTLVEERTP